MIIYLRTSPCLDVINNCLIYLPYIFSVGNIKKKNNISGDQGHNLKFLIYDNSYCSLATLSLKSKQQF